MKNRHVIALLLGILPATSSLASVTIDSFEDSFGNPVVAGYAENQVLLPNGFPHVIGGRGIEISATTPGPTNSDPVSAYINTSGGSSNLEYQSLTSGASGTLVLNYGTLDTNVIGNPPPTPLDLSVNTATDFLRLTFLSYNHTLGHNLAIDVLFAELTPDGDISTFTISLTTSGAQTVDIPLTDFPGSRLDYLKLTFDAPADSNFQLDSVALITDAPEPSTLAIFGSAAAILITSQPPRKTSL